jgi:N-acetylneuraminic acid mutarotase
MGAAIAGKIYVFGGFGADGLESSGEEYTPATDSWSYVSDLPTPRAYGIALAHGEHIYVMGGSASGQPRDIVERYHPATDTWATMASMPQARSRFAGDVVGDKIYVFGGFENHRSILSYDVALDVWSIVDSLPRPRNGQTATYLGSEFYIVAGSTPTNFWLDVVESYDPAAKDLDPLPPLPSVRRDHRASVVNEKLYVTGGYNSITLHRFFGSIEEYDPARAVWRTKSMMQIPRHDHVAVVVDGVIYCIGGYKEAAPNEERSVEIYDPALDP